MKCCKKKHGKRTGLYESFPPEFKNDRISSQGFFEHVYKDPERVLIFNTALTGYHMYDALVAYLALYKHISSLMRTFQLRFLLLNPKIDSVKLPDKLPKGCNKSALVEASNEKFFTLVMSALT